MPIEITVPRLGWSMEEGTFSSWLKREGELVQKGDPLFAVESDKVTMDVESLDSGVLHIPTSSPQPGDVVTVGQRLGYLLLEGEPIPSAQPGPVGERAPGTNHDQPPSSIPSAAPAEAAAESIAPARQTGAAVNHSPAAEANSHSQRISPRALALAQKLGVDVSAVSPRPGAKRIVEADIRRAWEILDAARTAPPIAPAPPVAGPPASTVRKAIAARMEESFRTPHFYLQADADARAMAQLREEMIPVVEAQYRVHLTYNDLLVKALAMALREMPGLNCYWNQGEIVSRASVNIGLAVQVNDGLLVPVIHDADRLSLGEIAVAREELIEKCKRSSVRLSDLEDGSMTLSNLGPFGVERFQAILNPPQSAILAVGKIAKRPVVDGDAVVARLTAPLTLSVDHRVVDGVAAAAFLREIVNRLESPLRLALAAPARPIPTG